MYNQLSKKSILCVVGVTFSVVVCYLTYEKYYKDDGLKKDK